MPTAARYPAAAIAATTTDAALLFGAPTAAARHAEAPTVRPQGTPAPRRATVTTARTLQRAERLLSSAETTRQTILESYVNVGTPTTKEILGAQAADPNCVAIRSYLATGHATSITGSDSLYHSRWIQREAAFIRVFDGGLLYRLDPQWPKGPKDKRPGIPQRFSAPRLYIPDELRAAYLHAFHERFGHPGENRMFNVLRERYYWPGLHADVVNHVRECHECTLAKRLTRSLASPERSKLGSYPFDNLTVDIVYMGITHDNLYDKLLVFADSLSRWVEAVPFLGDPTAEQVMDAFLCNVACRYGWPRTIRSDGGSNLASVLSKTLFNLTGVSFAQGAAYHSQSQGIAERVQGTLTQMARAADEGGNYWHDHLPFLLFSYHATPHRVTGMSPAMVMYGRSLRLPAQHDDLSGGTVGVLGDAPVAVREYAERQTRLLRVAWAEAGELTRYAQEHYVSDAYTTSNTNIKFVVGDTVCYRLYDKQRKLISSWFGPCRVIEVKERGNYILGDLPNQMKSNTFHVSQLRAYHATPPADVLAQDEYIVDSIRDRRVRNGTTQYLVKWRGHSVARSTWEPRGELMRRCADEIRAYDASIIPPPPLPLAAPPRRNKQAAPPPQTPPTPKLPPAPPCIGDALPHAARLRKGKWTYARRDSTLRGLTVKWIGSEAFSIEVLATPHFAALRQDALDSAPSTVAAAMRSVAEHISVDYQSTATAQTTVVAFIQTSNYQEEAPAIAAAARRHIALPRLVPSYTPTDIRFSCAPYGRQPADDGQKAKLTAEPPQVKKNVKFSDTTKPAGQSMPPPPAAQPPPDAPQHRPPPTEATPPPTAAPSPPTTSRRQPPSTESTPRRRLPPTITEEASTPRLEEIPSSASTTYRPRPSPLTLHGISFEGRGKGC